MKKINFSFWIGSLIVLLLVLVILYPSLFTKTSPYSIESMRSWMTEDGSFHMETAPFPPQAGIPFGTDAIGRDILALIVYGARLTLLLAISVVFVRFCVAIPMGIFAGFGSVAAKGIIMQFAVIVSAIPALLISIIILKLDYFTQLDKGMSLLAFTLVLTFVGWGKLGLLISERVEMILKEPFIIGDIAIGKSQLHMTMTTIIPHLLPELVVLFFLEFARALAIIMQMGVFAVYVGNVRLIENTDMGTINYMNLSYEPEWASMLAESRKNFSTAPWTVWYPAFAFFISVLGLNLFGEGLRMALKNRTAGSVNFRSLTQKKSRMRWASAFVVLILMGSLLVNGLGNNLEFNTDNQKVEVIESLEGPIVIGNDNAFQAATFISAALKDLGLLPLETEEYLYPYQTQTAFYPYNCEVIMKSNMKPQPLQEGRDYSGISFGNYNVSGALVDYRTIDLYNLETTMRDYPVKGLNILLDSSYYPIESIQYLSKRLLNEYGAQAVLWSAVLKDFHLQQMGELSFDGPALFIDAKLFEGIQIENIQIQIAMKSQMTSGEGNNVIAYLPGEDEDIADEAIIYGFSYNALDPQAAKKKIAFGLEMTEQIIRYHENRKRTIIIAFFDGTLSEKFLGQNAYASDSPYDRKKQLLFVDMTRIEGVERGQVLFSTEQSPITRYYANTFSKQMLNRFKREGVVTVGIKPLLESDMVLYKKQSTPTLIFGLSDNETVMSEKWITLNEVGRHILETITFNSR